MKVSVHDGLRMKVRIGYGLGTQGLVNDGGEFGAIVDALEDLGFDSVWVSERATSPTLDPLVALSFVAGRTRRVKLGTSVQVLPGRNPVLLAKAWASLDRVSGGRALPAFGLGVADPAEQQAFGVARGERAALFDEALALMRRLWSEEAVDHDGEHFSYRGLTMEPKPVQGRLDVWLGGRAPSELRRVGRLGDGWLPSFTTPVDVERGRKLVEEAASEAGRAMDPEHWGALVAYSHGPLPDRFRALMAQRFPEADPSNLIPVGHEALRARLQAYTDVGFSKLVPVLLGNADDWSQELERLSDAVLDLQN